MSKKPPSPRAIPPQNKLAAARLIVYELFMLQRSIDMPKPKETFPRSLAFEGVILHARVLRDFFYRKLDKDGILIEPKLDDILAIDYFTQVFSWPYTYAHMSQYLKDTKTRMDRTLAHLSYDRLKYVRKEKAWDTRAIRKDIGDRWFEFFGKLQDAGDLSVPHFLQWIREYDLSIVPPF